MATSTDSALASRATDMGGDLLLRETLHRCSNDLQLIVGLLSLQSRRVTNPEAREALTDATARVSVLARARASLNGRHQPGLRTALQQVCDALHSQAEPRGILISLAFEHDVQGLTAHQIATLALVANELATNAIKHAFEESKTGQVRIAVRPNGPREAVIIVDDDGLPFPESDGGRGGGMGMGLVKRLVASIDGLLIQPPSGSKRFEIRMPLQPA